MLPKKVACNATNSAAIDNEGNVWVWGAARHRLLGTQQENNQTYPRELLLQLGTATEAERQMRDAFVRNDEMVTLKVKEIAIGQYHMLALGSDRFGRDESEQ